MISRDLFQALAFSLVPCLSALAAPRETPSTPDPAALAREILSDANPAAEREAIINAHPDLSDQLLAAMVNDLTPGTPEEYRRIPWIWRVTIRAGQRNNADEIRRILDISLPQGGAPRHAVPPGAPRHAVPPPLPVPPPPDPSPLVRNPELPTPAQGNGLLRDWQAVVIGGGIINGISQQNVWPGERINEILNGRPGLKKRWDNALDQAAAMTDDEKVPAGTRYDALRMIALQPWEKRGEQLLRYLAKGVHAELQMGAISGLSDMPSEQVAPALIGGMGHYSPKNRNLALDALLRTEPRIHALLDALGGDKINSGDLGAARVETLKNHANAAIRDRARQLL